ncbi:hypothetical protein GGG17_07770 [Arsenicicoccus sp. MKL-02]|uniref:Uncharacterized protein n=1 Tax=Arsenicicoccus cauae TaxID=2663847 RepID=A0A6I3IY82_9MICO|nr:hypothetical protein [Arsenicicoccus cauae]MTB71866.1 hypothetical protein [Arsenicicoccus cauae]
MGFLDRLLGRTPQQGYQQHQPQYAPPPVGYEQVGTPRQGAAGAGQPGQTAQSAEDQQAIERYRYLLRTAPPEKVEEAHAEAFAKLTPEQRQQVLTGLSQSGETPAGDDPQSLARAATRAEMRQPGFMERTFGGAGVGGGRGGMGMGGMIMGSMLGSIAGVVVGTAVAGAIFDGMDGFGDGGADLAGDGFGDGGGDFGGDGGGDFGGGFDGFGDFGDVGGFDF